jgi:hypothetical protein
MTPNELNKRISDLFIKLINADKIETNWNLVVGKASLYIDENDLNEYRAGTQTADDCYFHITTKFLEIIRHSKSSGVELHFKNFTEDCQFRNYEFVNQVEKIISELETEVEKLCPKIRATIVVDGHKYQLVSEN